MNQNQEKRKRVVIAMSGGVDSSLAAALLKEQGYEVIGIMLRLWSEDGPAANRCCTPDSVNDAQEIADMLDIPFYVRDYKNIFKSTIVDYFTDTFSQGETPNPCVMCNKEIRYTKLLEEAMSLGADYLATGHYAVIKQGEDGKFQLFKGIDPKKDQSYMLHRLDQFQLGHALFPLGEYTKEKVREMAKERELPVFNRPDSQDLCFLGNGDYREFLTRHIPDAIEPGGIYDTQGNHLGDHKGLPFYTIGQRKGLGISSPEPLFVLKLDMKQNSLIVGTAKERGDYSLKAGQVTYTSDQLPQNETQITAKIRYSARPAPAVLTVVGPHQVELQFEDKLTDITPGQAVVFYQDDLVVGGGIIQRREES